MEENNENSTIVANEPDNKVKSPRVDFAVDLEVGNGKESMKMALDSDLSAESHKEIEFIAKYIALLLYVMLLEIRNPLPTGELLTLTVSYGKVSHAFTYQLSPLDFSAYKRIRGTDFDMNTKLIRSLRIWLHGVYDVAISETKKTG